MAIAKFAVAIAINVKNPRSRMERQPILPTMPPNARYRLNSARKAPQDTEKFLRGFSFSILKKD